MTRALNTPIAGSLWECYEGLRRLRLTLPRRLPASARTRSASLTVLEVGKTLAMSRSKTTTLSPLASRGRYLPRTPMRPRLSVKNSPINRAAPLKIRDYRLRASHRGILQASASSTGFAWGGLRLFRFARQPEVLKRGDHLSGVGTFLQNGDLGIVTVLHHRQISS